MISQIVKTKLAKRAISFTTRDIRRDEIDGEDYHFISEEEFLTRESDGEFFETTRYTYDCYGSRKKDFEVALQQNNVIVAVDICGAIAIKRTFPKQAILVFVNRPKENVLLEIIKRSCSDKKKRDRIMSLDDEYKNEELCDSTIYKLEP